MQKEIVYVGYNTNYSNPNNFYKYPSCNSKMDYILNSLLEQNYKVYLFSLGLSSEFNQSVKQKISNVLSIHYVATLPNLGVFSKLAKIFLVLQFVSFLMSIKKNTTVIVYHNIHFPIILKYLGKIKKINLIYEVEEIYNASWSKSDSLIQKEISSLDFVKKFIFVNDILPNYFPNAKEYVVCYGDYKYKKVEISKLENNLISLIYAGVIGDSESDVYLAIDTMLHLSSEYLLKIVGYGTENNINEMVKYIDTVNAKKGYKCVFYDGLLTGLEYERYLSNCKIGLSPRKLDNKFSDFTFPSKTLVYYAHNLKVVSTRINCIEISIFSKYFTFINNLSPQEIANTVKNVKLDFFENELVLNDLHNKFRANLVELIEV